MAICAYKLAANEVNGVNVVPNEVPNEVPNVVPNEVPNAINEVNAANPKEQKRRKTANDLM